MRTPTAAVHSFLLHRNKLCVIDRASRDQGRVMLPNFELLFGVPRHHNLVLIRSRGRGGALWGDYWSHQEVDGSGTVIASYESYAEVDTQGHVQCGWRKYDSSGNLIEAQTFSASGSIQSSKQRPLAA
jgi:hypothetical protein